MSTVPSPDTSIILIPFSESTSPTKAPVNTISVPDIAPVDKSPPKVDQLLDVSTQPNF